MPKLFVMGFTTTMAVTKIPNCATSQSRVTKAVLVLTTLAHITFLHRGRGDQAIPSHIDLGPQ
jgi:hypothetical protein